MSISINLFFLLEQSKGGFYIITQFWTWEYSRGVLFSCCMLRNSTLLKYPSPAIASSSKLCPCNYLQGMGCVFSSLGLLWCWECIFFCVSCFVPPAICYGRMGGTNNLWYSSFHSLLFFCIGSLLFVPVLFPWWWGVCLEGLAPTVYSTLYSFLHLRSSGIG